MKFDFVTVSFSRVQLSCCCVAVGLYVFAAEFLFIAATSKHSAIKEASCTPGRRTPKGTMTKNRKDLTPRHISKFSAVSRATKPAPSANIRVVIRIRPPNSKETGDNYRSIVKCREANSLIFDPEQEDTPFFYHGVKQRRRDLLKKQHKNIQFVYDRVFPEAATNEEVFCYTTRDLIDILMDGCNCSVFAYGATGAGKTYTMLGKPDSPGITVLTIGELFMRKEELSETRDFELFVTYLEVYNEDVRDLLKHSDKPLQLREDAQIGVRVAGLTHKKINNADELFHLLDEGNKNRTQHPTDSNAESSRSHAVFQVYLKMTVRTTGQAIMAKLSMIDLAGSERGAATGCKGPRFKEGASINKSLLALGNCINSLADGQKHVPYRDSKLTRILKDSLGGNCHTVMIANVSPSSMTFEDTYNTLKYATRAKKIKANVKKNIVAVGKSSAEYIKVIEGLNEEIRLLKEENSRLKESQTLVITTQSSEEITTTTCEELPTNELMVCNSAVTEIESEIPSEDLSAEIANVKKLFRSYSQLENVLHSFVVKQQLHEKRLQLKDEEKTRLNGLLSTSQDKEHNIRLMETMNRLRRRSVPYENEIKQLQVKIAQIKEQIKTKLQENSKLKPIIDVEQIQVDAIRANNDKHTFEALVSMQAFELQKRGEFMEQSSHLLQTWHVLLTKRGLVTKEMQDVFDKLHTMNASELQDGGDSGLSTASGTTSNSALTVTTLVDPSRTIKRTGKRKLEGSEGGDSNTDMDSTFATSHNSLFKELQPTPSKRMAKGVPARQSPRIRKQKENKATELLRRIRRPGVNVEISRHAHKALPVQTGAKPPFR